MPPARFAYRVGVLAQHPGMVAAKPREAADYLFRNRELLNVTYELENETELAGLVAGALGASEAEASAYLAELRADTGLTESLDAALRVNRRRNDVALLGKRRALYALVRLTRPGLVVEAGIGDGLGTSVLLRALQRNQDEGAAGKLLGFDISPDAGWLVPEALRRGRLEEQLGDIGELLSNALAGHEVDLFIHDTLKSPEHERFEFETAIEHGSDRLILYSDDDSVTGMLRSVCERHGGRSRFLREQPENHFWRGNLLGLCVLER